MNTIQPVTKIKYLTNKDLLEEIHKSKKTYSVYLDECYGDYDIIATDLAMVSDENLEAARHKRVADTMSKMKKQLVAQGQKNPVVSVDINEVPRDKIVVRVMTWEHIPLDPIKGIKGKTESERHTRLPFPPYQHWIKEDNGEWRCVGKSHWQGGIENGHFSHTHGKMTNRLALMFMKLTERYSHRGNWRGYTYIEDMRAQALAQLAAVGLKFDESRSDNPNPFAYYTAIVTSSFTRILNVEKRSQTIRDDLLIMAGATPSFTRQVDDLIKQQNDAKDPPTT